MPKDSDGNINKGSNWAVHQSKAELSRDVSTPISLYSHDGAGQRHATPTAAASTSLMNLFRGIDNN